MDVATGSSADAEFAASVLRNLLQRIEEANSEGRGPYLVSHAWTTGPMLHVVYTAPPSDRTWGLARDTTESVVDPGPWPNDGDAARYYYLVDFEENQPSTSFRRPGDDDTIWWFGHPRDDLPDQPSDLPADARYQMTASPNTQGPNQEPHIEPRRYGNRFE